MSQNNTATRIIVAITGIPLILFICWYGKILFLLFASGIGLAAFYEFSGMTRLKNNFTSVTAGYASVVLLLFEAYTQFIDFKILIIIISLLVLTLELFRNKQSAINNAGSTLLGIFYIGLFSSTLVLIREYYNYSEFLYQRGGYIIISVLITIWICDSAAFFLGTALGKHKLFPRVSPHKSWEGAIAGFIFSLITMVVLRELLIDFIEIKDALILGIIVGVFGQMGDLVESLLKRDVNIKDSSAILPGHGGIFDRFDSFLFSSPFVYLYMFFFFK